MLCRHNITTTKSTSNSASKHISIYKHKMIALLNNILNYMKTRQYLNYMKIRRLQQKLNKYILLQQYLK